ncbi:helix-turn-helix domain-containing protein [Streptomyces sp. NPDC059218]|uniref:helix-turn-helix domain-containing protein n=1 Tax=unclassified Streptomyces TaxID=2593676 RepID=UPI0036AAEAE6
MRLLASADGNSAPVFARLAQADKDTVRDMIHKFSKTGLACLGPRWAGDRPRLLDRDDENLVFRTATTLSAALGKPAKTLHILRLADDRGEQLRGAHIWKHQITPYTR